MPLFKLTIKELTEDKYGHDKWKVKGKPITVGNEFHLMDEFYCAVKEAVLAKKPVSITASEGKTIYGTFTIR